MPKDRVCDDTAIELDVEPRAQWLLQRRDGSATVEAPLAAENWLLRDRLCVDSYGADEVHPPRAAEHEHGEHADPANGQRVGSDEPAPADRAGHDQWLSQVEIITHAGPHRRLWMGPQFIFKTYNAPSR